MLFIYYLFIYYVLHMLLIIQESKLIHWLSHF